MAVCFSGLHYLENYSNTNCNNIININYKEYIKNIKTKIYGYFEKDFNIDTFICTHMSDHFQDLLQTYSVVRYRIDTDQQIYYLKKLKVLHLLQNYIKETNKQYDVVLLTRFDIYIMKEFTNDNVFLDKLNIVSILENDNICDDNLFIFPINYLKKIIYIIRHIKPNKENNSIHYLKRVFEKNLKVNYICNDKAIVKDLSFFKLRFFCNLELILNRYLFSDNVVYNSINNNSQIILNQNSINFKKNNSNIANYCWFGYDIKQIGFYKLSFDIYSNKDIIGFDFIKLHNPIKMYRTCSIYAKQWTTIDIVIEVTRRDDFVIFIFDNFNDTIEITFTPFTPFLVSNT